MSEMNYEDMLDHAYDELPEVQVATSRFEIPKVRGHIQGASTVISNFHQICSVLGRKPQHVLKFLLKELAAKGDLKKNGLIINAKIPASRINERIEKYAEQYVICKECGKPDTRLFKERNFMFIKCQACGAKYSVKG